MKIQCDVCGKEEATVFCCADEAALCENCDRSVHRANKLASKHRRFSLLHHPSLSPICDICQERKALIFCQEDRAILCHDCDAPIHAANEHTKKHNRFLLAGVNLSLAPISDSDVSTPSYSSASTVADESEVVVTHHRATKETPPPFAATCANTMPEMVPEMEEEEQKPLQLSGGSTISDYLIKTLPGWHVEDLLGDAVPSPSASIDVLSKMGVGEDLLPLAEGDRVLGPSWWVPQVPQVSSHGLQLRQGGGGGGEMVSFGSGHQRWGGEDVFAVPQMAISGDPQRHQHGSSSAKRTRVMW